METLHRNTSFHSCGAALFLAISMTIGVLGCASPGVPRPPSLNLPQQVRNLTASRIGDTVEIRFAVSARSVDKLPLRGRTITAIYCRAMDHQDCVPIESSRKSFVIGNLNSTENSIGTVDILPAALTEGAPRLLEYRVTLNNEAGRSAGDSVPAFTAAGASPLPVEGLTAEGSRLGVVLRWNAVPMGGGDVILRRENLAPAPLKTGIDAKPNAETTEIIDFIARPGSANSASPERLLDTSALPDTPYRYTAMRRFTVPLGGRSIDLSSAPSAGVEITLHAIYPPLPPRGLTAAAFISGVFAVDLVWEPVDESGLIATLAGYNLYREGVDRGGKVEGGWVKLNSSPLVLPAFHDVGVFAGKSYRYGVTAVDVKGNESGMDTVLLGDSLK